MEEEIRKTLDDLLKPLSDYDQQVLKTQRFKKKIASKVPQLGTQSKQFIPDLKVLSIFDQQVSEFNKDTGLTIAQIRGEDAIPTHEGTYRETRPLTPYEQQLLDFAKSSSLTTTQLLGEEEIVKHKGANRPEYVSGRELV
jgi:hypothetical protein